jgi:hypothetical protein
VIIIGTARQSAQRISREIKQAEEVEEEEKERKEKRERKKQLPVRKASHVVPSVCLGNFSRLPRLRPLKLPLLPPELPVGFRFYLRCEILRR